MNDRWTRLYGQRCPHGTCRILVPRRRRIILSLRRFWQCWVVGGHDWPACLERTWTWDIWFRRRTCSCQQLHSATVQSSHATTAAHHVVDGHVISRWDDRSARTMTSIAAIFVFRGACAAHDSYLHPMPRATVSVR